MADKNIKKERVIRYFVEAALDIMETEGIGAVTARKVADKAGYTVSSLYNHFDNLDYLLFFASIHYLKDYALALPKYIEGIENPIIAYIKICECFNTYAFRKPEAYHMVFFSGFSSKYNDAVRLFYQVFPEELPSEDFRFLPVLLHNDIHARDYQFLLEAARQGYLSENDVADISSLGTMLFKGTLERVINYPNQFTPEEASRKATVYLAHILIGYNIPEDLLREFL
ncbi:MAG: TetR/AcrR family transcriptional regulator [Coprococcus sp.]|nr:TetR/AcrR family transcriptional regulator [Coprococcus sp.]